MSDTWKAMGICAGLLALGLVGCDDDGGSDDAGGIVVEVDSGPPATDAGPDTTPDAGPGGGGCSVTGLMPLPAGCLPRCSAATATAIMGCGSAADPAMCQQAALEADTTAPTTLGGANIQLDCETCFIWQSNTCVAESCPTEFQARVQCDPMMDPMMCEAESMALDTCISANMATLQSCVNMRAPGCFP